MHSFLCSCRILCFCETWSLTLPHLSHLSCSKIYKCRIITKTSNCLLFVGLAFDIHFKSFGSDTYFYNCFAVNENIQKISCENMRCFGVIDVQHGWTRAKADLFWCPARHREHNLGTVSFQNHPPKLEPGDEIIRQN